MQMEKQMFYKMQPYDASASVPMVIFDGREGRSLPTKVIQDTTQLIDIFPTIMEFAQVDKKKWPEGLDGYSLMPMLEPAGQSDSVAAGSRPDFVVSQYHGESCAMSWFMIVRRVSATEVYKLIHWGTGQEVPSKLYNTQADPSEDNNLIATEDGAKKYASIVADLDTKMRTVIDYPKVALDVAQYGRESFLAWANNTKDWKDVVHGPDLRWDDSWDAAGNDKVMKSINEWTSQNATRSTLVGLGFTIEKGSPNIRIASALRERFTSIPITCGSKGLHFLHALRGMRRNA